MPQQVWDGVADQVREDDTLIFEAIKASNFYAELPKSYNPDLASGLAARRASMHGEKCRTTLPIRF